VEALLSSPNPRMPIRRIMVLFRLGSALPAPGVSTQGIHACLSSSGVKSNNIYSLVNLFSGGALLRLSVFALGIMPYITSSIIIQLLMVVIPKLEQWRDEGATGQKKLTQATRYMTVVLALLQSTGLAYVFDGSVARQRGEPCLTSPRRCSPGSGPPRSVRLARR